MVVWGLPLAIVASAYGFFIARLVGDTHEGVAKGFVCSMVLALLPLWRVAGPLALSERYRRFLAWSLLLLPFLRLKTGGLSWGEALIESGSAVLLGDAFCIVTWASLLIWPRLRQTTVSAVPG